MLVTSRQTGFSVKYLYQMSLDILYLYGTFSGMAKKYDAYHLGGYTDEELDKAKDSKERLEGKYHMVHTHMVIKVQYIIHHRSTKIATFCFQFVRSV